ncbi:chemotaxis protein CheB [Fulvivirga sediminis]|uniref:protein-glutamate methylesterase n=1 Tax=Fulvivirga sediminis TaxID=2803949 RepID=A0A937K1B2_9BACT|nr:chemotaxis protein CheB [Fulvivirga sediminis]MBL3658434.1 chemotaxis protein CheB [Fulvivirga sediminis]
MNNYNYVVTLGASAGGLESLKAFFSNLHTTYDESYIVIQHALRSHKSLLVKILSRITPVELVEIEDGMNFMGNKIYICPPSHSVTLEKGKLKLIKRQDEEIMNFTVNESFKALSQEVKDKMVGIVMSGTGSDGAKGCTEIEKNGGVVLVQDPGTAIFESMPLKSIIYDHPDYVLAPEKMPKLIQRIVVGSENKDKRRIIKLDLNSEHNTKAK